MQFALAARRRAHLRQGRRDEGRAHHGAPGRAATSTAGAYSRPLALRQRTKGAAHIPGPYTIPNVMGRHLLRLHQPRAGNGDARLRRHGGGLRPRSARWTSSRTSSAWTRWSSASLNAYRDGDMKAHRREAKNTALVECVQVAAEKAKWPIREEFKRASSRTGGGGQRATHSAHAARRRRADRRVLRRNARATTGR